MTATCVLCKKEPEWGYLCSGHFARLGAMLRDIEDESVMLDAVPSMAIQTGSGGGSLASERAPARLSVLAYNDRRTKRWEPDAEPKAAMPAAKGIGPWCLFCEHETCVAWRAGRRRDLHDDEHDAGSAALASVLEEIHNWARLVREERELSAPDRITVTGERDLLTRNLEWIAGQPWVDECYGDLRKLLGQLQTINHTAPDKPVGRCYLAVDGQPCAGMIRRSRGQGEPWRVLADRCIRSTVDTHDGPAYCDQCHTTWEGSELARMMLILEQIAAEKARPKTADGRPMLTAQELASREKISLNAVRLRLSRARIKAVNGYYDPDALSKASA